MQGSQVGKISPKSAVTIIAISVIMTLCSAGCDGIRRDPPEPVRPPLSSKSSAVSLDEDMEPPPPPEKSNVTALSLDHLFAESKRIVVRKSEVNDTIIYESNRKPELALLREVMAIVPTDGDAVPCRCVGAPVIEFYYRKRYVGWVALHDGGKIRTSFWNTDAAIADLERFLKWFDRRGIAGPRRRAESEGVIPRRQ